MKTSSDYPDSSLTGLSDKKRPVTFLVILSAALACVLIMVFSASFIWSSRDSQLRDAEVANTNVASMIAVQVELVLKTATIALIDTAERVEEDGAEGDDLARLEVHLVEMVKSSPELHGIFYYGRDGAWLATALGHPATGNNSDREYFRYHMANPGRELHVGPPIKSRSTGAWVIPISRRINQADGSFDGVVLVTLRVDFFEGIYDELDVGTTGTVLLALNPGTLVYRRPFDERLIGTDISHGPVLSALSRGPAGTEMLVSAIDHIERLYSYRRVAGFPFIVAVGRAKDDLLSQWRRSSLLIGGTVLLICLAFALLAKKLIGQIVIRDKLDQTLRNYSDKLEQHNLGLQVLAHTDKLTNLANRRVFDEALEREFKRAQRREDSLSLILLDVDFFKKYNDRYGHVAGDAVLQSVGRVMSEQVIRAGDLPARYGGEEFVVILPSTDRAGAIAVAERIRVGILALQIAHEDAPVKLVSASFGVATVIPGKSPELSIADVITQADQQLYQAKGSGRNKVCPAD